MDSEVMMVQQEAQEAKTPVSAELQLLMKRQQYGLIGKHSRVKVCHWTKSSLRDEGGCYKHKFYGIQSHQCVQMTPSFTCNFACNFCWRDHAYHTSPALKGGMDEPIDIVEKSIISQRKLLSGFGGHKTANAQKVKEAMHPKHVAISLDGEPTLYPKIAGLIAEYTKRGMTTFLVSNGSMPEKIREIVETAPPTQLYISLDAPNKELFQKIDNPMINDAWERIMETLDIVSTAGEKTRTVLRMTLIKGMNMCNADDYAQLFNRSKTQFVEVKAYMWVGHSQERMEQGQMPYHEEVVEFAQQLAEASGYEVVDEHVPSRVVLLMRKDAPDKIIDFSMLH
jgi:tRNA wybutosine-synthesizing protein 1